ncbi:hypothetical protein DSO57_1005220 [Entomophthora muscae]|uniref:Uncharacterized protein n=1 Tax=Entomophthora muscae TaxID=34485 RepID=A0ACC2T7U5_9FUNG|nr:hypothetical protein DSO57_1005220 [Entomophthora muscae]
MKPGGWFQLDPIIILEYKVGMGLWFDQTLPYMILGFYPLLSGFEGLPLLPSLLQVLRPKTCPILPPWVLPLVQLTLLNAH